MNLTLSKESVSRSLKAFKSRRDALLHEDSNTFNHHLDRFIQFLSNDELAQQVLSSIDTASVDHEQWIRNTLGYDPQLSFPDNSDEELILRFEFIKAVQQDENIIFQFGFSRGGRNKKDDCIDGEQPTFAKTVRRGRMGE